MPTSSQKAYGLIEVLIAIAILAGLALLISEMIPQQQKDIFTVTDRAECQNRIQNIASNIKKYDNQNQAYSWLPGNGRADNLDPRLNTNIPWATSRITKNVMGNFPSPVYTPGTILVAETDVNKFNYTVAQYMESARLTDYSTPAHRELDVIRFGNMWQLSQNASALLYSDYVRLCAGNKTNYSGFLNQAIGTAQLKGEQVSFEIDRLDLSNGNVLPCDVNWEPLPLNSNHSDLFTAAIQPQTSVNHQIGYRVTTRLTYLDKSNNQRLGCETNITVSPGSHFNLNQRFENHLQLTRVANPQSVILPNRDWISCNPQAGQIGWRIGPACLSTNPNDCEAAISYLCRLDYMGKVLPGGPIRYPIRSTGWFICSLPPAGLDARSNTTLTTLSASNTSDANNNTSTQLMLGGTIFEGQYRLHVMGVDRARNVAVKASNIFVDKNAPGVIALIPPARIHHMGQPNNTLYGHLGSQTIPLGRRAGDAPSTNSPWEALKNAFANSYFQCEVAEVGNWTVTSGPGNPDDLNIAPNGAYGLAYGLANATLSTYCADRPTFNPPASGEYKVHARACDACNNAGTPLEARWYADFISTPPNPLTHSNELFRGQGAAVLPMSFTRTSTVKGTAGVVPAGTILPIAHTCEVYNGPTTPNWTASIASATGISTCHQSEWQNAFG